MEQKRRKGSAGVYLCVTQTPLIACETNRSRPPIRKKLGLTHSRTRLQELNMSAILDIKWCVDER